MAQNEHVWANSARIRNLFNQNLPNFIQDIITNFISLSSKIALILLFYVVFLFFEVFIVSFITLTLISDYQEYHVIV